MPEPITGSQGGIDVAGLTVSLGGALVLDGVAFAVPRGALALVGNNGAGKSTLLRVLATLQPAGGTVIVDGQDLTTWAGVRAARRRLGYLPAEPDAPASHTVVDAATYGAWLMRVPRAERTEAVNRAIELVGLSDRRTDRLTVLSSGLRQRALLARTLVHDPTVVLLDEPTAAVDPEQRTEIRRTIRLLAADRVVVFSTHLIEDVEHAADHALVLQHGTSAWCGPAADLVAIGRGRAQGSDDGTLEAALRWFNATAAAR